MARKQRNHQISRLTARRSVFEVWGILGYPKSINALITHCRRRYGWMYLFPTTVHILSRICSGENPCNVNRLEQIEQMEHIFGQFSYNISYIYTFFLFKFK